MKRLARNTGGGFAVYAGMLSPILLGTVAGGLDYFAYVNHRVTLQDLADTAALSAVREAALEGWSKETAQAIADSVIAANFEGRDDLGKTVYRATGVPDEKTRSIRVTITQDHFPYFAARFFPTPQIQVDATASSASKGDNICVIGLDESATGTVSLDSNAKLTASTCAVYSNSTKNHGMASKSNAVITAALICSAGGLNGANRNFRGPTYTNCVPVDDPLVGRPEPTVGGCTYSNRRIDDQTVTLTPGVYCGGLRIDGNSRVTFQPGIYIIKNGQFIVDSNSRVYGRDVGFFFTGAYTRFEFLSNADIDLEGPETGPLAGMLFYQRRNNGHEVFKIHTNNARNMVGVIYLPNGRLEIDADTPISDESAYTAIIAKRIHLRSSPNLVLNTAYGSTDVPVPSALSGAGGDVRLID
ncbi:MAG: TadE/TadG family type IV pilus assembly protein [Pseudomonadota bacterium]